MLIVIEGCVSVHRLLAVQCAYTSLARIVDTDSGTMQSRSPEECKYMQLYMYVSTGSSAAASARCCALLSHIQ
jgi:hypothetical protein